MVFQKAQETVENLKNRPRDERKYIAGVLAVAVVVILFLVWAALFFKKIQGGGADVDLSALQSESLIENTQ